MSEATGLEPVMTFQIGADWIGIRVDQMESVASASQLWRVPLTRPEYVGLHLQGEHLVPVMDIGRGSRMHGGEQLIAILQVRGEPVGVLINQAGRVLDRYYTENTSEPPLALEPFQPRMGRTGADSFWLIDTDKLWLPHPTRDHVAAS